VGGPQVAIFFILATVLAVLQNVVGVLLAVPLGMAPLFGVLNGSVTLTGGPATGLAFAPAFEAAGVSGAATVAVAAAMVGIVSGGLIGGPVGTLIIERYDLRPDGHIATTFTYNDGAPDGPPKRMTPVGTVVDTRSNAIWTMRFIWPFEADYRIAYLAPDYSQVIIGREKRDYVWIMARSAHLSDADYAALVARVAAMGYDTALLQRVPQKG